MRGARTATRCAAGALVQATLTVAAEPCRVVGGAPEASPAAGRPSTLTHAPRP